MTSAPRHTHDTLVEALCEFRLAPSTTPGWTAKSPGQLLNQLQAEFPNMEPVNETGIEFTVDQKTGKAVHRIVQGGVKIRYSNDDGSRLVQVSPNLYCFNILNNYPGWEAMRQQILAKWRIVSETVKPHRIDRIGLRYINKLPLTPEGHRLQDWLQPNDYIPKGIIESETGFSYRLESRIASTDVVIVILVSRQDAEETTMFFDIDRIATFNEPLEEAELAAKLTYLHDDVRRIFDTAQTTRFKAYLQPSQ